MKHSIRLVSEIIWLLLSLITLGFAAYDWIKNGLGKDTYMFLIMCLLSVLMYAVRRARRLQTANGKQN